MNDIPQVTFMDGGSVESRNALNTALTELESNLDQILDWDQGQTVMLAAASFSSLGSMGLIEFRFLDVIPDAVNEHFMEGFPIMVDALVNDVREDNQNAQFLAKEIDKGFLGWVLVAQGWERQDGEEPSVLVRMVGYHNIGDHMSWASRRSQTEGPDQTWGTPESEGDHSIYLAMKKLTEVAHYLRIRRDLLGQ